MSGVIFPKATQEYFPFSEKKTQLHVLKFTACFGLKTFCFATRK
jgi:hypothetical protein